MFMGSFSIIHWLIMLIIIGVPLLAIWLIARNARRR
jgi:hypothetical protein